MGLAAICVIRYQNMILAFLLLSAAAVVGMAVIIIRRFPQLANLDVDNLPAEQELRKKKSLINRRVNAEGNKMMFALFRKLAPLRKPWGRLQLRFRVYVGKIERLWHHEQRSKVLNELSELPTEAVENKLSTLVQEGTYFLSQNNLESAEERFIAAVKLDAKYAPAYRGLGDTYLEKGALTEAEETYQFFLQLEPDDEMMKVKMSELLEKKGNLEQAITYLQQAVIANDAVASRFYHLAELLLKVNQPGVAKESIVQAVELEPKNPKYLDLLIEIGVSCGDKDLAKQGFQELRMVNPDNQKLIDFQERIQGM